MSRSWWPAAVVVVAMGVLAVAASGQRIAAFTVPVEDREGDGGRGLDLIKASLGLDDKDRLVGQVRASERFTAAKLRDPGAAQGSICLRLFTKRVDDAEPPDYLVCAMPRAEGTGFTGRVMRDRANGLPRTVANAVVTRPNGTTLRLRFSQASIRKPERVRFAAEVVRFAGKCPPPLGCRDSVPDSPAVVSIRLR